MIPLAEAREHVLSRCAPRAPLSVPLSDALGCVLAGPVTAGEPVPPWANSAMDGYAVRSADVASASEATPVSLPVVATVAAGAAADTEVGAGQAVRIMTGAPMPLGADAVVMVERTRGGPVAAIVEVLDPVEHGRNVRAAGSDIAPGQLVADVGTVLGPAHLGVLASVNVRRPIVVPRPRLGIISTGDELVDDGSPLEPGQIRESNRPMLVALARTFGVDAVDLGTVADDRDALATALAGAAATCDAVATSGGVSMGDFDLVKVVLGELADMRWMQVAIRPAKPFAFGVLDGTPVFGLPGNPVSSMVSLALLGVPGLRRLAGRSDLDLPRVAAVAGPGLGRRPDGRTAYQRVSCRWVDGRLHAHPVTGQGSHQLASAAGANALAELPDGDGVAEGDPVTVVLLAPPL
ncbi:MAG TPA: gephyrin-like molybdotransferase Glp [Acidimicrobiales bacterium]|nr:gephyrin-like molybdotransferase Glp [Acidimicrobiales bacterium]